MDEKNTVGEPAEDNKPKLCTMCGKELDMWDKQEKFCFDSIIGYGSGHDCEHIHIELCCDCFDRVFDMIRPLCKIDPVIGEAVFVGEIDPAVLKHLKEADQLGR